MDAIIQQKVCKILKESLLAKRVRAGLILSALAIDTDEQKERFNLILDSFIDEIQNKNNSRKGDYHGNNIFEFNIKEASEEAQSSSSEQKRYNRDSFKEHSEPHRNTEFADEGIF